MIGYQLFFLDVESVTDPLQGDVIGCELRGLRHELCCYRHYEISRYRVAYLSLPGAECPVL